MKDRNLRGMVFGRLTVIGEVSNDKRGGDRWACRCECGNMTTVSGNSLTQNHTKSCGCLQRESASILAAKYKTKHGLHNTRLYTIWKGMTKRCRDSNAKSFKNYGGRGITVCEEWRTDFQAFYDWSIQNGYRNDLSIDRIDVNGNYEPSNCRWATRKEQSDNKRSTVKYRILYNGEEYTVRQLSVKTGISEQTIYWRVRTGREALTYEEKNKCAW